jgi:hypothetical protein
VADHQGGAGHWYGGEQGGGKKRWRHSTQDTAELEDQTGKSVVTGENFLPPGGEKKLVGDLGSRFLIGYGVPVFTPCIYAKTKYAPH